MDTDKSVATCSECGKQMREGFIQCGNRIAWVSKVSKLSVEPNFQKDAVVLSKQNRFQINFVKAYLCEECKRVVIDYTDHADINPIE